MSSIRTIGIEVNAEVSGQDDVRALASQLDSLADTLEGDLKTQAQESAKALRELGGKLGAIDNFVKLKSEAGGAADRLREAQTAAQQLGQAMAASGAPTRAQAVQMEKLRDAVRTAKAELQGKTAALDQSRATLKGYGIATDNLAQAERNLKAAMAGAKAEAQQLAPTFKAAGIEVHGTTNRLDSLSKQLATLRTIAGAALGGTLIGSLAKDLADVADGYDNLQARIKLATGEGQAFESAMSEVQRISLETNTSLESTGTLFARLTDAGRSAGLSAQDAQADALGLTEVINQAIQVSGASAQAADAAVTQLIQALNAGVLRGEEFNSVVEQSPRLAKAMADGLGVTIGELRKMAQAGQLSATVVRDALRGQSEAVRSEFEKLPPTVGRALENLSTAWTVYVGEVNKSTGASKAAASAIKALADNLGTVVDLLIDLGQAAAAFAALRLAQQFLGIGAAATTSAAAIAANTAAVVASNTANAGSAAAVAGVTASVGKLATAFKAVRAFSLAGILVNAPDIGKWIGESIAKLAGYRDMSKEIAEADRERAKTMAVAAEEGRKISAAQEAANKAARDSQFELSKAATETVAQFEELRSKGQSASEAVSAIGKDFDLSSLPGIANAAGVLDKLAADGKLSADQVRQAWAEALKGEDLQAFEVKARAALSGTARESERLAAVMDASLREAIRRSGADFDVLAGGMTKATRSAINDTDTIINGLDKLKEQGVNVGAALEASISKGIKTADSQAGVEALRTRIESLRGTLGEKVADGLLQQLRTQAEQAGLSLDKLPQKVEDVATRTAQAFKNMGIQTAAELKKTADAASRDYELIKASGQATAEGLSQAWRRMAEASIAANGGVASETLKAEAAMHGLEIATDQTGRAIVKAMDTGGKAVEGFAKGVQQAQEQLKRLKELQGFAAAGGDLSGVSTEDLQKAQADLLKEGGALSSTEYIKLRNELMSRQAPKTDKDGFTLDKSGNRLAMGGDLTTLTGVKNFLMQAGLDEEQAKRVAMEFSDGRGNIPYFSNPGQMKYGGATSTISEALLKAAERTTFGMGGSGGGLIGGGAAESRKRVDVNIQLNGQDQGTIPTDEQGEDVFGKFIDKLKRDKMRSARR